MTKCALGLAHSAPAAAVRIQCSIFAGVGCWSQAATTKRLILVVPSNCPIERMLLKNTQQVHLPWWDDHHSESGGALPVLCSSSTKISCLTFGLSYQKTLSVLDQCQAQLLQHPQYHCCLMSGSFIVPFCMSCPLPTMLSTFFHLSQPCPDWAVGFCRTHPPTFPPCSITCITLV